VRNTICHAARKSVHNTAHSGVRNPMRSPLCNTARTTVGATQRPSSER
jgi:hypothetical protein